MIRELVQLEPTSAFPESQLKEGMAFEGEDEKGEVIIYYIKSIADGKVEVDGNHPWAGQKELAFLPQLWMLEPLKTKKFLTKKFMGLAVIITKFDQESYRCNFDIQLTQN